MVSGVRTASSAGDRGGRRDQFEWVLFAGDMGVVAARVWAGGVAVWPGRSVARDFGSAGALADLLDGSRALRECVGRLVGGPE